MPTATANNPFAGAYRLAAALLAWVCAEVEVADALVVELAVTADTAETVVELVHW
jgi:hypothetical protein